MSPVEKLLADAHHPASRRVVELEDFLREEARRMNDLAAAMRNPERTGGWKGAERVAAAFDRSSARLLDAVASDSPSNHAKEIKRLRDAIAAIKQATIDGRVCDDVAWFSSIETLHDYCDGVLSHSLDQLQLV